VIALMSQGRKRGYCGILATQRLSKLHKDAAAECNNVLIGRTWLDVDQNAPGHPRHEVEADRNSIRDLRASASSSDSVRRSPSSGVFRMTTDGRSRRRCRKPAIGSRSPSRRRRRR
jgi:DNA helicase HerA-like ATPase